MVDARVRWAVILCVLALTVGAIFYPTAEESGDVVPARADRDTARRAGSVAPVATSGAAAATQPHGPDWVASDDDPFMARGWQAAPAPVPVQAARAVEPVVVADTAPPPPPPLPYQFVGQMVDDGNQVIYLSRGDQVLLARQGETVEGTYKVLNIGATQIEFETLSSGLRQTLPIPAQDR
jgi:hypothetical protein